MIRRNRSRREIEKASLRGRQTFLLAVTLLGGYLLVLLLFGDMGVFKHLRMIEVYQTLQAEEQTLLRENRKIREEIAALRTDASTIERLARERLGMIRPGEVVYRFYPSSD